MTLFDTADAYGSGASERVLGEALRGRRDTVTIATKGGYVFRPRSPIELRARRFAGRLGNTAGRRRAALRPSSESPPSPGADRSAYSERDFSPEHLRAALTASLRRLGTDHVDVFQLHGPPEVLPDLLGELDDLRQRGLVRAFGVGAESVGAASMWADDRRVDVIQLPFGVLDPDPGARWNETSASERPEAWIRGVLGGGVLATAMRDGIAAIDHHHKQPLVQRLMGVAQASGVDLDELALRWAVGHGWASAMIIGISDPTHLRRNLELVGRGALDDGTMAAVGRALTP